MVFSSSGLTVGEFAAGGGALFSASNSRSVPVYSSKHAPQDILVVSLSFQLPAIDGFCTGFLIFRVTFFLSAVTAVSLIAIAVVFSRADLEDAAAGGAVAH